MNKIHFLKNKLILIVDDEEELLKMIVTLLKNEGYNNIVTAKSFNEALKVISTNNIEAAILDIMLPDGDGFSLLQKIRISSDIPVLFLSAKDDIIDQCHGLSLGADDYLTKPFYPEDLLLRLYGVLNRAYPYSSTSVPLKHAVIHFDTAEIEKEGTNISLTAKEFTILKYLYENANRIVTIDSLCQAVWGFDYFGYENSLMTHIRRIRTKIESNPSSPESLVTIKGLGYKLLVDEGAV